VTATTIGLVDFRRQWAVSRARYLEAVDRVGESGWLILGNEVQAFEGDLSRYWGLPYAVGCGNGLDALEIAFRCVGMRRGDLVLTTPLSAFATTLALLRVGAEPVFADVDASGLLDLEDAEDLLAHEKRVRFVVPVHLYGHAMNLGALERFSRKHGLVVVEDCAQAIGAKHGGRPVGDASLACATSFYPTKNLGALGDGGAVLTRDATIRDRARSLRDYGQSDKYVHDIVGLNSRLDELHAAILRSVQLPALSGQTVRRAEIARRYRRELKNDALMIPPLPDGSDSVWHLFPLLVPRGRESFRAHLSSRGIATGLHYPRLIPAQKAMAEAGHPPSGRPFPNAERFAREQVSIPNHPFLTDSEVSEVIDACNSWSGP
jgi:dTDP-3-amino-3,4,6-trideoxy-alpha-D-glucose transaminase